MKKFVSILLIITLAFSASMVFADTDKPNKDNPRMAVFDQRKIPEKNFSPLKIDVDESGDVTILVEDGGSGYWWVAKSVWSSLSRKATSGSWSYTDSTKSTRKTIDLIAADTRLYQDGGLDNSATDSEEHSSYAGASCYSVGVGPFNNYEVYGNHTFEQSGYQSWYPETYDT